MDIGGIFVKLGLDFSGFKQGMQDAKESMSGLTQDMNKAFSTAGVNNYAESLSGLKLQLRTAKNEFDSLKLSGASLEQQTSALKNQIDLQQQVIAKANEKYQQSVTEKGELTKTTLLLQQKLSAEMRTLSHLESQLNQVTESEKQTDSQTKKTGDSFLNLGNIIKSSVVFGGVYAGLNAIKDGFEAAVGGGIKFDSQMQQNLISFQTMLGSADKAKSLMNNIVNMAAATPFETADLTKASQELLAFGIANEKIMPTLQMLGDVSQGDKERFKELTLAFAQIQSAGKMQGGDLLQLVNAGFNPLQIISQKTGQSMADLRKQMEKGAISADMVTQAFKDATSKGGMFYNAMQNQSTTFAGLMSTLQDNLHTTFGTMMKPVFDWLTSTALPKAIDLTTKFTDALKSGGTVAAFKTIIPPNVVDEIINFGSKIKEVFGWMQEHSDAIKSAVLAIGSAFLTYKTITGIIDGIKAAQMALNLVMEMNPYIAIASAVVAAGVLIYTHWSQISKFLTDTWNSIKSAAESIWNPIATFFLDLWNKRIVPIFSNVWNVIKEIFAADFLIIYDFVTGQWGKIPEVFRALWSKLGPIASEIWNSVKTTTVNLVLSMWDAIVSFFENAPSKISSALDSIKTWISNAWESIRTNAVEMGGNIVKGLIDGITNAGKWVKDQISSFFGNVTQWAKDTLGIKSPSKVFHEVGTNVVQGFANGVTDNLSLAKNAMEQLGQTIKNTIESFVNGSIYGPNNSFSVYNKSTGTASGRSVSGKSFIVDKQGNITTIDYSSSAVKSAIADISKSNNVDLSVAQAMYNNSLAGMKNQTNAGKPVTINVSNTFNTPTPSASEISRAQTQSLKQMATSWGLST